MTLIIVYLFHDYHGEKAKVWKKEILMISLQQFEVAWSWYPCTSSIHSFGQNTSSKQWSPNCFQICSFVRELIRLAVKIKNMLTSHDIEKWKQHIKTWLHMRCGFNCQRPLGGKYLMIFCHTDNIWSTNEVIYTWLTVKFISISVVYLNRSNYHVQESQHDRSE